MRVLVTGGCGWIGAAVVAELAATREVVLADVVAPAPASEVEVRIGDLASWKVARTAVRGVDAIVHLASGGGGPGATPADVMSSSVVATVNVLEAAREAGIGRVVLMSSAAVVTGYPRCTRINARTPPAFAGLYPLSKWLQEVAARQFASEHAMVVPILRPWVVVDAVARRMRDGRPLDPAPDPFDHNGVFGWVDRHDLASACVLSLDTPLEGANVFHLMASSLGRQLFDVEPAERLLGWRPVHDFAADVPPNAVPPRPPGGSR